MTRCFFCERYFKRLCRSHYFTERKCCKTCATMYGFSKESHWPASELKTKKKKIKLFILKKIPTEKHLYQKLWRQKNKAKLNEYYRKYYQANKQKYYESSRRYIKANPERIAILQRAYYQRKKERQNATL